jgi:hypothetical protein
VSLYPPYDTGQVGKVRRPNGHSSYIRCSCRSTRKVGFSVTSLGGTASASSKLTKIPFSRELRYASRSIRSKKAAFAEDFHLPPVRNFSASEVWVDSMGSPRGALARNQETSDKERTLWSVVAFFSPA